MNSDFKLKTHSLVKSPVISVIIPFYGDLNDLTECLEGLSNQNFNFDFEIIVSESGNDSKVEDLINFMDNAQLISSSSLMYPGKARNLGVKYSNASLLAFIDSDCVPSPCWLSEIYFSLNNGNDIVIGPVLNLYPFHPVASVDNIFLFTDFQKHRSSKNINHFAGCSFGISKKLFYVAERFPEDSEIAEDTIFSEKVLKKGKVCFNKKMIVKHKGRKEIKQFKKHHEKFGFYKGYLNLKTSSSNKNYRKNYFYPAILGLRRLIYILIRTLQWNPVGLIRVIIFFPLLLLGISSWIRGFRNGELKFISEISIHDYGITLDNSNKEHI
jgi:glycosyltransferase involved in cell wall biosynthesis